MADKRSGHGLEDLEQSRSANGRLEVEIEQLYSAETHAITFQIEAAIAHQEYTDLPL